MRLKGIYISIFINYQIVYLKSIPFSIPINSTHMPVPLPTNMTYHTLFWPQNGKIDLILVWIYVTLTTIQAEFLFFILVHVFGPFFHRLFFSSCEHFPLYLMRYISCKYFLPVVYLFFSIARGKMPTSQPYPLIFWFSKNG